MVGMAKQTAQVTRLLRPAQPPRRRWLCKTWGDRKQSRRRVGPEGRAKGCGELREAGKTGAGGAGPALSGPGHSTRKQHGSREEAQRHRPGRGTPCLGVRPTRAQFGNRGRRSGAARTVPPRRPWPASAAGGGGQEGLAGAMVHRRVLRFVLLRLPFGAPAIRTRRFRAPLAPRSDRSGQFFSPGQPVRLAAVAGPGLIAVCACCGNCGPGVVWRCQETAKRQGSHRWERSSTSTMGPLPQGLGAASPPDGWQPLVAELQPVQDIAFMRCWRCIEEGSAHGDSFRISRLSDCQPGQASPGRSTKGAEADWRPSGAGLRPGLLCAGFGVDRLCRCSSGHSCLNGGGLRDLVVCAEPFEEIAYRRKLTANVCGLLRHQPASRCRWRADLRAGIPVTMGIQLQGSHDWRPHNLSRAPVHAPASMAGIASAGSGFSRAPPGTLACLATGRWACDLVDFDDGLITHAIATLTAAGRSSDQRDFLAWRRFQTCFCAPATADPPDRGLERSRPLGETFGSVTFRADHHVLV